MLKDDKFLFFGIVILFLGINFEIVENKDMYVFIIIGMFVYEIMNIDLN